MTGRTQALSRFLLPVVVVALPVVLLLSSLRTMRELDQQKAVYLRNRVAMIAGRLENLPDPAAETAVFQALSEEEPNLVDLQVIDRASAAGGQSALEAIWDGRELFRTQTLTGPEGRIYRAYVPFHSSAGLRIARIDLDARAADFLVVHARHNVIVALLGGLVVVLLALYAIWASRRAAKLEIRQLEMEHLAHLGTMAATLAHEIRNPLGTIKGFAQLAGERADASVQALLDPILGEARRLENLVNDLLLYGRPPSPSLRPAKWEETLIPLEAHARQMIGTRDIRFQPDRVRLEWETDPHLLQQALLNLVRNAVEAIGEAPGGEVRLAIRRHAPAGLTLAVIDNGPGIPEAASPRLFEPFFTTKAFGTGLGLSITRKLARALGGEFTLRPSVPRGTEAILRFPQVRVREVVPS
ncbi:MAG: HAMP domain-containing sensor histidine kinase [Acidobacteria bacterium]|nr:HAMP domain-containing sensor histidine kinase [Acidobacteriota bacterium]